MNPVGVLSQLFRGSPASVAEAVRRHGLSCVQLTPNFPGLTFLGPEQITPCRCRQAAEPFQDMGILIACLSGNTNLMDHDLGRRQRGIDRLHSLIRHCRDFGTSRIVTETGTLSPKSPWAPYPPNRSREAWSELQRIVAEAVRVAADHGVTLLLKPDNTHVLAFVEDAAQLREELHHPNLGFVLDPANFLMECAPAELDRTLEDLVEKIGPWAPVVHAKDLRFDRAAAATPRAGLGVLDYRLFFQCLRHHQPQAPVILEHLRPEEIAETRAYLEPFLIPSG
jgi:sugar phosphate isomerase/epimerase